MSRRAHLCVTGKSLAVEWAEFARVNTVSPGYIDSGLTGECNAEVKTSLGEKAPMRYVNMFRTLRSKNIDFL